MEQAVKAWLDRDKRAVRHERAHGSGDGVAHFEPGAAFVERAPSLLFENHAAIDHNIFIGDVELGDAAGDGLADERFELGCVTRAAAAGRHESADADVDAEAALYNFSHGAGDGGLVGERELKARPVARLRHAEAREIVIALLVAAGDR